MTKFFSYALAIALVLGLGAVGGAPAPAMAQEQVYGSQIMTQQERLEHRERMRAAQSDEERQAIRNEHHAQMQERAKEMGVTLPDEPPADRGGRFGFGPGKGMGGGMSGGGGRN